MRSCGAGGLLCACDAAWPEEWRATLLVSPLLIGLPTESVWPALGCSIFFASLTLARAPVPPLSSPLAPLVLFLS